MSKTTSAICDLWSQFNIENVKRDLDERVIEIAKLLEEGDDSRKRLIEQTKEFRKTLNDEQRKLVAQILKPFQLEVDSASKRSKLMEQVLLNLYKQLIDLPDPVPALESVQRLQKRADRAQDLELENKALKETLDEFKSEFAQVKNQEPTIKLLRDRIKELEEKNESQVASKLKERERDLQKSFAEKEEQFQSSQLDLVKKLGETEARLASMQSQLQKSQADLYELKSKQDELLNAKSLEIDMLMQDIDKLNERVASAERLSEQYAKKLAEREARETEVNDEKKAEIEQQQEKLIGYQTTALEIELAAKDKEISQLVDDVQKLQMKSNKMREFYEQQRIDLEDKLSARERSLEQLEYDLKKKLDYDEIKKELSILKAIEFNEHQQHNIDQSEPSSQQHQKPLEVLLLEKNRYLQNENTQIKNKLNELQSKHEQLVKESNEQLTVNLEQKSLIVQLERDLLRAVAPKNSASSSDMTNETRLERDLDNRSSPNESLMSPMSSSTMFPDGQQTLVANGEQPPDTALFNIVSSQRERFRARVQELEAENLSSKQQIQFLTNQLDSLRSDNVKLYEKIRFLQSFPKGASNSHLESYHKQNGGGSGGSGEHDEEALNKYTTDYEKKLDPFSKFTYREKQKRYSNLKLHDKFTLNFAGFILSSRTARLVFFAYFLIIHLLIFGSMYWIAHKDATHRDYSVECAQNFRDHMFKVHGEKSFQPSHSHHK